MQPLVFERDTILITLAVGLVIGLVAKPLMGRYGPRLLWCAILGMASGVVGGVFYQIVGRSAIGIVTGSFLYQYAGVKFDTMPVQVVCAAAFSCLIMFMTGVLIYYHWEE